MKQDLLVLDLGSTDVNELQQLSLQYANHIQHMVTQNEKLLDVMHIKSGHRGADQSKDNKGGKKNAAPANDTGEPEAAK